MSFDQLMTMPIVLEVPSGGSPTAWGHAPIGFEDGETVYGLIQELTGREYSTEALGGTVIATGIAYLPISAPVSPKNQLRRADTGQHYRILDVKDAAGQGQHFECPIQEVVAGSRALPPVTQ